MLGICRQVTPYANVIKFGTVGPLGYVIALTAVGPHRLTGFGVSRHQSWVPSIDKAHQAYYTAVPATAGTHDGSDTKNSANAIIAEMAMTVITTVNLVALTTCSLRGEKRMTSRWAKLLQYSRWRHILAIKKNESCDILIRSHFDLAKQRVQPRLQLGRTSRDPSPNNKEHRTSCDGRIRQTYRFR